MNAGHAGNRPRIAAERRTGVRKGHGKGAALDRVLWTATGITYRVGHPPRGPRPQRANFALDVLDGLTHALMLAALVIITTGG